MTIRACAARTVLSALCAAALLGGCAGERFLSNDRRLSVTAAELAELRRAWSPESAAKASASALDGDNRQWTLDFIAYTHRHQSPPCERMDLLAHDALPLQPLRIQAPGGPVTTIQPRKYLESWFVFTCGRAYEWRIVDDPDEQRYPELTVLLWQSGPR